MLPEALTTLVEKLKVRTDLCPNDVVRMVRESAITPATIEAWADFDHPPSDGYGRKMVHKSEYFEIMVMSWNPGDFAAIHDHGYATWGAVQIFGPAEHATFRVADDRLSTLARWTVDEGDVIGVSNSLIHQMGNPTKDQRFLSLHVYGCPVAHEATTGDARIYDLERGEIQRVNGGVFFELPQSDIERVEPGVGADFPSRLRHMVELIRRLDVMHASGAPARDVNSVYEDTFSTRHHAALLECLATNTNEFDHQTNSVWWRSMGRETKAAAALQLQRAEGETDADTFRGYARIYDELIGETCMNAFMRNYLHFVQREHELDFSELDIISLGCGTGLVEEFMIKELGARHEKVFGFDHSPSMVEVAKERIHARQGDILDLDSHSRSYDLAYSGLNVFHYLDSTRLGDALAMSASVVKPGGHFIADFITPDHIRWYPNIVYSADRRVISLRSAALVEDSGRMFQESEITNISFLDDQMLISHAGTHRRFLPPMHRVRQYIAKAFGREPTIYDAHSLAVVPPSSDTCESTRYVAVVQKS